MGERVTVELPVELADRARVVAARSQRALEDVLVEWIDRGGAEPSVEGLPDDELLALCDLEMPADAQEQLSDLLEARREGILGASEQSRLEELMRAYRRGLLRKSQALHEAVARGLRPQLT